MFRYVRVNAMRWIVGEEDRKAHCEMEQDGMFVIYRTAANDQKLGLSRGSEHGCSPPFRHISWIKIFIIECS
jgi:hypothetical protein